MRDGSVIALGFFYIHFVWHCIAGCPLRRALGESGLWTPPAIALAEREGLEDYVDLRGLVREEAQAVAAGGDEVVQAWKLAC